jgi:hypothetical protein
MPAKERPAIDLAALKEAARTAPVMAEAVAARQVVVAMKTELLHMNRVKGYTWAQVAEWLCQQGVPITEGTLKNYLYTATPSRRAKAARKQSDETAKRPVPAPGPAIDALTLPDNATEATANGGFVKAGRVK